MLRRTVRVRCGSFRPLFENPHRLLCVIELRTARIQIRRKAKHPCAAIKPDREKVGGKTAIRLCRTKQHEDRRTGIWMRAMTDEQAGSWPDTVRAYEEDR